MLRPIVILTVLAALGLGSVIILPEQVRLLPSAVRLEWPEKAGEWVKVRDTKPSPQEIAILANDTVFSKAEYVRAGSDLVLDVGIVLGGDDPNNSIHRPERCLVAQGHANLTPVGKEVPLSNGRTLPVTRLFTRLERQVPTETGEPVTVRMNFVTYYWFVGNSLVTGSHYARTFKDMSDRLFLGSNQKWAYITVAARLRDTEETRQLAGAGQSAGPVDTFIQDFLKSVIPGMIDYGMIDGLKE